METETAVFIVYSETLIHWIQIIWIINWECGKKFLWQANKTLI